MNRHIRVVIAEDQAAARQGLKALLSSVIAPAPDGTLTRIEVVGEAISGWEAVMLAEALKPDTVLMDIRMPGMDGLQATRLIKARCPGVRVVVLTLYSAFREEAQAAGADAFVVKGCASDILIDAVLSACFAQHNSQ